LSALICVLAGILYIAVPYRIFPVCGYAGIASPAEKELAASAPAAGHGQIALSPRHPGAEFSGRTRMVCFWTARAETGPGILMIFGGLLLLFARSRERRLGVTLMLAGTAVFGAAIPYGLIGVCGGEAMPCRAGTLPALLLLSGFFLLFALLNVPALLKDRRGDG
jgi:hypothetical protein